MIAKYLLAAAIGLTGWTGPAWAGGLQSLEQFIQTVHSGRAEFSQTVSSSAKTGQAPHLQTSTGEFVFARPDRFKFVYQKPLAQIIVADGNTLSMYDIDLNQISRRNQSQALAATPAALIASAADVQALQAHFVLREEADQDGLQWLLASPKNPDSQLQSVRVGFAHLANGQVTLSALEINDIFGQHSVLQFSGFQINPDLPADTFAFTPPSDADVLQE